MSLAVANAIWIGSELGQIRAGCLRSFLRQGHRVVLHCYERPKDTPTGIEIADANNLLPQSRMIYHRKSGSPSLFSDLLRYELLGAGLGLYVDCDVFCLHPISDADYIFGMETSDKVNTAVMKLPATCPVLADLRSIRNLPTLDPPWIKKKARNRGIIGRLRGNQPSGRRLEDLRWGAVGPSALTYYLKQHGLIRLASPIDRFYPVHWDNVALLFDPGLSLRDVTTPRTDALHLYYSNFARLPPDVGVPKGSPIWELLNSLGRDAVCPQSAFVEGLDRLNHSTSKQVSVGVQTD